MGKVLEFRKKDEQLSNDAVKNVDRAFEERCQRIKQSLEKINNLMVELKSKSNKPDLNLKY